MADCCCGSSSPIKLLYACSGAANTGYLADSVARALAGRGIGKLTCLSAVGAGLSGFVESAKAAAENLVIDGCPVACGQKVFENLGIPLRHVVTTDYGVEKGRTEITAQLIASTADRLARELASGCDCAAG
jgi:uncharacterized metal-binding protein